MNFIFKNKKLTGVHHKIQKRLRIMTEQCSYVSTNRPTGIIHEPLCVCIRSGADSHIEKSAVLKK